MDRYSRIKSKKATTLLNVTVYLQEMRKTRLTSLTNTRKRRHMCTSDECLGVMATKRALALKLVAACQGKLTLRVLWPLCRWTIEPCIRMKYPSAVTKPAFVSAAVVPLFLCALMTFSAWHSSHTQSGRFVVDFNV